MENAIAIPFEEDPARTAEEKAADALIVSLDGYEGPIDLLLTMARDQKVDLRQISILALAEQYLAFVEKVRKLRIELAADYLVMAAWLAYLKSKLLLPAIPNAEGEEELSGEALAEALAFQLQRLEAMQKVAKQLFERPQLGLNRLPVGLAGLADQAPVAVKWQANLFDILDAYGAITRRANPKTYDIKTWPLMSMDEATMRLANMIGHMPSSQWKELWKALDAFMPNEDDATLNTRSAMASTLTAALEMVKQEKINLKQEGLFGPIYISLREQTQDAANDA
ncbi:MAG: segregation/condensation protein A [Alphaproteobacteria bacterium]|nr:segregation/condensation protein A [Alphaproteobacteria bacterium]